MDGPRRSRSRSPIPEGDAAGRRSPPDDPGDRSPSPESEGEGEDIQDEALTLADYRAIPALDQYDSEGVDDEEYDAIDEEARIAAEELMRRRDAEEAKRTARRARTPAVLNAMSDSEEDDGPRRVRRRIDEEEVGSDAEPMTPSREGGSVVEDVESTEPIVNLDDFKGNVPEYLMQDAPRKEIKRRFRWFLSDYRDKNSTHVYPIQITNMCSENKQSLEIDYLQLSQYVPILAIWLADEPEKMLALFDEEAMTVVEELFPQYRNVTRGIHVRVKSLPVVDQLRDLRQVHLNCLVKVVGVVTRRTSVYPQLKFVKYTCGNCKFLMGPYIQHQGQKITVGKCHHCESTGPFLLNMEETIYENYQKITLQESPGSVPAGRVPRQKDVVLLDDLIDSVSPGMEVEITGVYQHNFETTLAFQQGFPVFNTAIKANYVEKRGGLSSALKLTDEDIKEVLELSKQPDVANKIFQSIGPSIYGHDEIKTAIALAMFGGEPKEMATSKHRIRGDINVLIMGDPGTAKSQFLKYVEKTASRAVYTTGKGASAVGLTASVRTDPITRDWTLEGGALVLADQGVCLIDEFDKMNDQDRTSIHEAMEQQTISISKAGIITSLKARCSVIAAANPIQGRYDSSTTFAENVDLSDAILSRFDCSCVVRDLVEESVDRRLANFVVSSHVRAHPLYTKEDDKASQEHSIERPEPKSPIQQALLRKYIMYARQTCHPKLHNIDDNKIAKLYADLRQESMASGGIPIAIRHIESIIRMSEAHAKMHLREYVIEDDVNLAIRVMLDSFIKSQKFSVMTKLRKHFSKYVSSKKDTYELLLYILRGMVNEALNFRRLRGGPGGRQPVDITCEEFEARASEMQITNLIAFYASPNFQEAGYTWYEDGKFIRCA